jgi:hypothetical protein
MEALRKRLVEEGSEEGIANYTVLTRVLYGQSERQEGRKGPIK